MEWDQAIRVLTRPSEVKKPLAISRQLTEKRSPKSRYIDALSLEWIKHNDWAAVLDQVDGPYDPVSQERLLSTLPSNGISECFAVSLEPRAPGEGIYRFRVTHEGLIAFARKCNGFYCLMVDEQSRFAVLCTPDDYCVYGGPRRIVEAAVGKDIETAREEFQKYAIEYTSNQYYKDLYRSVVERYGPYSG